MGQTSRMSNITFQVFSLEIKSNFLSNLHIYHLNWNEMSILKDYFYTHLSVSLLVNNSSNLKEVCIVQYHFDISSNSKVKFAQGIKNVKHNRLDFSSSQTSLLRSQVKFIWGRICSKQIEYSYSRCFTKSVTGFFVKLLVTSKYWSSSLLTRMSNTGFPLPLPLFPNLYGGKNDFCLIPKWAPTSRILGSKTQIMITRAKCRKWPILAINVLKCQWVYQWSRWWQWSHHRCVKSMFVLIVVDFVKPCILFFMFKDLLG